MTQLSEPEKAHLKAVFNALPRERIRFYLEASSRNPYEALRRYDWNSKLSSALFETIGHFEVDLRTTIDAALTERHIFKKRSGDWLDNAHDELSERAGEALAKAREDAIANRRTGHGDHQSGRGHVIAELNFSFWRRLLDRRYEQSHGSAIMRRYPDLRRLGTTNADMSPLRDLVEPIYALRNRIAHHEPVWRLSWRQRNEDMLRLIRASSPELASWVEKKCRLGEVAAMNPAAPPTGHRS
ncbi:Abi family protein [Microbacterium sp. KSW-18]|uniref:Abi family protein n=1 Tax=Microbacterium aquilitoris TaxID=3067307 RepID=A0ABU3GFH7_9MICO|nr:Abi family protein [Microbacterium sp. KSW-18]MDT3329454.1 Abi family protein [Microbacterium sp. KSW-18]